MYVLSFLDKYKFIMVLDQVLSPSGVNAPGLSCNSFWRVGSVDYRFYCLEASSKGSSLERFPTLLKKKKKKRKEDKVVLSSNPVSTLPSF
jgi:hypothetical protein